MKDSLVSIIIPVYNGEKYLRETVISALAQTWANKEIILVDDGSTDSSLAIAKEFEGSSVRVLHQENKGASTARNNGLGEANGDYIQFLDADDLLSPDKIEKQLIALNGSISKVALCATVHFEDGQNHMQEQPVAEWFYKDENHPVDFLIKLYSGEEVMPGYGGMIQPNAWLTPVALIKKAGNWDEKLSLDDDGEFFCRIILESEGIKFSSEGLNFYRKFKNDDSLSSQKSLKAYESITRSTDSKYAYLKERSGDKIIDRVFARHYWWTGVGAYPQYKSLSDQLTKKALKLGYSGEKYVGGPAGHQLTKYLGWKAAKMIFYYRQLFKKRWTR